MVVDDANGVDDGLSVIGGVRGASGDGLIGWDSMFGVVVELNSGLTVGRVVVVGGFFGGLGLVTSWWLAPLGWMTFFW